MARLVVLMVTPACAWAVAVPAGAASTATAARARPQAAQVVLVSQPARSVCTGHKFRIGVWYQQHSGGSRAYRVSVSGPRHRRFFHRAGQAPSGQWRFWRVLAGRSGRYRIVYSGHRPGSSAWTRYVTYTRAHRCT